MLMLTETLATFPVENYLKVGTSKSQFKRESSTHILKNVCIYIYTLSSGLFSFVPQIHIEKLTTER